MSKKPMFVLLVLALASSFFGVATPFAVAAPNKERVRVIVELTDRGKADDVVRAAPGASKVKRTSILPYVMMEIPATALAGLRHNPHVRAVTEDVPDRPYLDSTLPVINGDDVHAAGFTGVGAAVAILDTGIDADHPFFSGRILAQHCFSDPNDDDGDAAEASLCPDGTTEDSSADSDNDNNASCVNGASNLCAHGSNVAGIAAGSASTGGASAPGDGVAPGAGVVAVQVFTRFNNAVDCSPNPAPCVLSYTSDQILALDWVRGQAAANPSWNLVSANMSLGGGMFATACDGDSRKTAIDSNLSAGIATVIASGNSSFLNAVGAPGCISTAVTVGRTNDDDTTTNSGNRGPLLDVMAPGSSVTSSVPDNTYAAMSGTSMSAPHVAGALAVLRAAAPTRPVANLITDITSTGVPITYSIGGSDTFTTPRLDLLAALNSAAPNQLPTITVNNATVIVDEGSQATNSGSYGDPDGTVASVNASIGTITLVGGTWNWSYTPADGPASIPVTVTVTDNRGDTASVNFTLTVNNVAPTVAIDSISNADEGGTVTVKAHFSDPGDDTHTAAVDWGTTQGSLGGVNASGNNITATYTYGDNGTFTIKVTVTDSDGASGSDAGSTTIANVSPEAAITGPASTTWNGQQIIFGTAGSPVAFEAEATDPGSDDLAFDWAYGDGATDSNVYLVNPPATDPALSPTVQPRDVSDNAPHTYALACAATVGLEASDDDGGDDTDSAQVIILGTSTDAGTLGVWQTDYRDKRSKRHTVAEKLCLLSIVRVLSSEFSEAVPLASTNDAVKVLYPKNTNNPNDQFDAMLLSLWLNVADGSIALSDPVDSDGNGSLDSTVGAVIQAGEALRLSANPARADLLRYKSLYEAINAAH